MKQRRANSQRQMSSGVNTQRIPAWTNALSRKRQRVDIGYPTMLMQAGIRGSLNTKSQAWMARRRAP
jgi:hypothetical protein